MIEGNNILTVGVDCSRVLGGVSAVEMEYSKLYKPWQHVTTATTGSVFKKWMTFLIGLIKFNYLMIFKSKINIIHIHGASYSSFWRKRIIVNIAKFYNKKVVYHCHGAEFKIFTSKNKDVVVKMLHKCDCVVCLSESWKKWFEEECGCERVEIIKNVISNPVIEYARNENKNSNDVNILFLGELGKRKGIYDLLDVLADMKDSNVKLMFGGNGEVDKVISRITELGIKEKTVYLGWVSGAEKIDVFNIADIFVLPSYNEGLPISILEAMSYGLPILSTTVGGIPEIVENGVNGFLVEPGDKNALLEFLEVLVLNKTKRLEMGEKSRLVVADHLPNSVESQLKNLYNSL